MHERGVIFNDLHMFNIMVRPDDTVVLIDFEAATHVSEGRRLTVGNPGFVAPRDRTGFAIDAYSTACIRLAMFMPLTTLFALDHSKAAQIAAVIAEHFPVPAEFLDQAVSEIVGPAKRDHPGQGRAGKSRTNGETAAYPECQWFSAGRGQAWNSLSGTLVGAIRASATPSRTDRLFPGDIEQFTVPGGGAGVCQSRCDGE